MCNHNKRTKITGLEIFIAIATLILFASQTWIIVKQFDSIKIQTNVAKINEQRILEASNTRIKFILYNLNSILKTYKNYNLSQLELANKESQLNLKLVVLAKKIHDLSIKHKNTLTPEYFPEMNNKPIDLFDLLNNSIYYCHNNSENDFEILKKARNIRQLEEISQELYNDFKNKPNTEINQKKFINFIKNKLPNNNSDIDISTLTSSQIEELINIIKKDYSSLTNAIKNTQQNCQERSLEITNKLKDIGID